MQASRIGKVLALAAAGALAACEVVDRESLVHGDEGTVPAVTAQAETVPVPSMDDAADDPAIWLHPGDPARSLILGTDKQAGVGVYTLDGKLKQFLPAGEPNNVDLRQDVRAGNWRGDLAAASNRAGDRVTLFSIDEEGAELLGEFPAGLTEPYGACMGIAPGGAPLVFVTYKTGQVRGHLISAIESGNITQQPFDLLSFESQLEGCVFDEAEGRLYIGEEGRGIWYASLLDGDAVRFSEPRLIDEVGMASGLAGDVEGLSLADGPAGKYLVVSSQGNDSYAVYSTQGAPAFLGRFRIRGDAASGIDGAQETDGLAVHAGPLGEEFPQGLLVVQDGFNAPSGSAQNFKLVDWRQVMDALDLSRN